MNVKRIAYLSLLLAVAVILGYIESFLPSFLPGVKLGLPNIIILLSILIFSWYEALLISILRVFIVSLLCGSIFQLGFYTSLGGALASFLVMYLLSLLKDKISPISISLAGSFFHVLSQVVVVYLLLSFERGTFYYLPILLLLSLPTGLIVGITVILIRKSLPMEKVINTM